MLDTARTVAVEFSYRTIARSYDDLHAALRARADELQVTRATLDVATGLTDGHSGKLLGPGKVKKFGPISLGLMLQALGLALIVVEDPEALARNRRLLTPRLRPVQPVAARTALKNKACARQAIGSR